MVQDLHQTEEATSVQNKNKYYWANFPPIPQSKSKKHSGLVRCAKALIDLEVCVFIATKVGSTCVCVCLFYYACAHGCERVCVCV